MCEHLLLLHKSRSFTLTLDPRTHSTVGNASPVGRVRPALLIATHSLVRYEDIPIHPLYHFSASILRRVSLSHALHLLRMSWSHSSTIYLSSGLPCINASLIGFHLYFLLTFFRLLFKHFRVAPLTSFGRLRSCIL